MHGSLRDLSEFIITGNFGSRLEKTVLGLLSFLWPSNGKHIAVIFVRVFALAELLVVPVRALVRLDHFAKVFIQHQLVVTIHVGRRIK
jgi:hypothetical protein